MNMSGWHIYGSFYNIKEKDILTNIELMKEILKKGILLSHATLEKYDEMIFPNKAYSLTAFLSESHVFIHTYPEESGLFFDAFTCGEICQPKEIAIYLLKYLNDCKYSLYNVHRMKEKSIITELH